MAKSFYRLKDVGTTFFDATQGAGVVADRVAPLENTARVKTAVSNGELIKLDVAEGKAAYDKQQAEIEAQSPKAVPVNQQVVDKTATVSGGDGSNVAATAQAADTETTDEETVAATDTKTAKKK